MDTYGEKDEGQCWTGDGSGRGRCWPFLSGERGHYELLAGNTAGAQSALTAMVASANPGGMLPEQVWDAGSIQDDHGNWLVTGKGTKSATPLGWTHGEFLKLLRSLSDQRVFDWLAEVEQFAQSTDGDGGSIYDT
jgi:glucoamylase